MTLVNDAEVARLLAASREAHLRKKRAAGTINAKGDVANHPDYPQAESFMAEALRLRLEAHQLDPDHTAPAWSVDQAANKGISHEQLVSFMTRYAEIP